MGIEHVANNDDGNEDESGDGDGLTRIMTVVTNSQGNEDISADKDKMCCSCSLLPWKRHFYQVCRTLTLHTRRRCHEFYITIDVTKNV